jgi:GTP-binding protein
MLIEALSQRQAQLTNMKNDGQGNVRLEFRIPTKGLIGFRGAFVNITRGEGVMNSSFIAYEKWPGSLPNSRMGVLVSSEAGEALPYGLNIAQGRGLTFIGPHTQVYEGMIIGLNAKPQDSAINVTKEKKKTNVRASTADIAIKLTPPEIMSLEQAMAFINSDELLEVTPESIRLRKKLLNETQRLRAASAQRRMDEAAQAV